MIPGVREGRRACVRVGSLHHHSVNEGMPIHLQWGVDCSCWEDGRKLENYYSSNNYFIVL